MYFIFFNIYARFITFIILRYIYSFEDFIFLKFLKLDKLLKMRQMF